MPIEERRRETIHGLLNPSSAKSCDNIFESVQGLRQITKDISLNEIVAIHNNAKELIENLSSLQTELRTLNEIKHRLNGMKADNYEEATKDPLKRFSHRQPPNNLIPFPAVPRLAPQKGTMKIDSSVLDNGNPPTVEAEEAAQLAPNLPPEQEQNPTSPTTLAHQQAHAPLNPLECPAKEKEMESDFASTDYLIPFPVPAKDSPRNGKLQKDFPVWEKNPLTVEPQGVTALARVLAPETKPLPSLSKRAVKEKEEAKEKGRYQVTYSFADKRAGFDQRVRELVRSYGEVDIYSSHDSYNRKRNAKKAVFAALLLILVFSVFPGGGATFLPHPQRGESINRDPSPAPQPTVPKTDALVTLTLGEMDDLSPISKPNKAKRKPASKTEETELLADRPSEESSAKSEERKKHEISAQPSATRSPE